MTSRSLLAGPTAADDLRGVDGARRLIPKIDTRAAAHAHVTFTTLCYVGKVWDPESDDDYRVRWWLAMLGVSWLRIAIFVGFAVTFFSLLFLPANHRDGTPLTPGERAVPLVVMAIAAILVMRIDRRRQRDRRMHSDADDEGLTDDRDPNGEARPGQPPASSCLPEP